MTIWKKYNVTMIDLEGNRATKSIIAKSNAGACIIARLARPGDYVRVSAAAMELARMEVTA